MWTKEALHDLIGSKLQDYQLIVVANREPYIHRHAGKRIECMFPASGMVTALDPIMRACGGIWVGHGSGDADRETVDARDHVKVPPDAPSYTLRRVWASACATKIPDALLLTRSNRNVWHTVPIV